MRSTRPPIAIMRGPTSKKREGKVERGVLVKGMRKRREGVEGLLIREGRKGGRPTSKGGGRKRGRGREETEGRGREFPQSQGE